MGKKPEKVVILPDHLKPRENEIKEFLAIIHPDGPWSVNAVHAYKERAKMNGGTFTDIDEVTKRIVERNGNRENVWFSVGRFDGATKAGKAAKADILSIPALWIDLDVDKSLKGEARDKALSDQVRRLTVDLPEGVPKPSVIVASGNGHWAFWMLRGGIDNPFGGNENVNEWVLEIEERNYWLAQKFDADHCHNIDRIARIPGTINWPTKTKQRAGLEPVMSKYLREISDPDLQYELGDFERMKLPASGNKGAGKDKAGHNETKPITLDELERKAGLKTRERIEKGSSKGDPKDRSKVVWLVIRQLISRKVNSDQIRWAFLNRSWRISDHIYDQANPISYVNRQIRRAVDSLATNFQINEREGRPYKSSTHNCRVALNRLGINLAKDTFTDEIHVTGLENEFDVTVLNDTMLNWIIEKCGSEFEFDVSDGKMMKTIDAIAHDNRYDSLITYLDNVEWDGTPRGDRLFVDYGKCEDTPLNKEISRCFLLSCIGRAYEAGFKADESVVLEGPQDAYKSSFVVALVPDPEMFSDNLSWKMDSKEIIEISLGKWIIENGGLNGIKASDIDHVKAVMSRQVDEARMAYGRIVTRLPRRFLQIGTTNERQYLADRTGNRRFRPIRIREGEICDVSGLIEIRDQLWGEMVARWNEGERPIFDPDLRDELKKVTQEREVENPVLERLKEVLGEAGDGPDGKIRNALVGEIAFGKPEIPNGYKGRDLKAAMVDLGFEQVKLRFAGVGHPSRGYRRISSDMTDAAKANGDELFPVRDTQLRIVSVSHTHGKTVNLDGSEQF